MKEKKTVCFSMYHAGILLCAVTLLLVIMPMSAVAAKSAGSGATDFEIPMNELSREQQESPAKTVARKAKIRKKSAAKARGSKAAAAASAQRAAQGKAPASSIQAQNSALQPEATQPYRIFNVPYSFVVTGKSTVIKAVIYREAVDLQAVNCRIRVAETGALSLVKMAKVDGSRFTYTATLPEVVPDASALRYTIHAIDASGTESVSTEFVTPVTFSPLVPGWQL
ncbi:MAG TPA: hypothetical protein HPP97_02880 [Desulfuromonadales bacterium]|nr:hypothetical protein [Desulfuromonadales bacterium]